MSTEAVNNAYKILLDKREDLQRDLKNIEKQIYDLEGSYLEESCHFGNILRGWDGYFSGNARRAVKDSDRIFSLSSMTAPQGSSSEMGALMPKREYSTEYKKIKGEKKKKGKIEGKEEKKGKKQRLMEQE